jgi:alkanesulfonate monooxygenase SsuD/methylene tetrahydromethanopterin reductase-like flavin-dependent oxidoreductase (luciferase family)
MTSPEVGVTLPQFTDDAGVLVEGARRAEALGFDSIWLFDHLWPLTGGKNRPVAEGWTALAWLAAATERITIGTLVTRSTLRHPAVLAKMAATVATIAPGRVVVGLGSGDDLSRAENEAYGLPFFAGPARLEHLGVVADVVRRAWAGDAVTTTGPYAELRSLPTSPTPKPPPRLWVGGNGVAAVRLAARVADGWNAWGVPPETLAQRIATLAELAGDRPIEPTWGGVVRLASSDAEAERRLGGRDAGAAVVGGPDTVARRLSEVAAAGARHLVLTLPDAALPGSYELLAETVSALPAGA